ncbi:MAG TPA: 16S rRNA (cytosine(1402)-N(4))-methyltransferase [Bacteroidetes bacterium]|nr:16S rRNA (cytosine(1402)-N(4))-methyltransferase [Bacteroidota bacterium]
MKPHTENAVTSVHRMLRSNVRVGDIVIDATVGNGWDTQLLAECVGHSGLVYGFDIQQVALDVARVRLGEGTGNVRLLLAGHETMRDHIEPHHQGAIRAVTFNLGYLPGGEKELTTKASTTMAAIRQALELLMPGGLLTVVCYSHPEGRAECESVQGYLVELAQDRFSCLRLQFVNQSGNPPVVFAVYKASDNGINA